MYDPNARLSTNFTLADLTATSKQLSMPNMPQNITQWDNLTFLADVLEELRSKIGPFSIISGFRTKELQNILTSSGDPTAQGTSFHELGRAVDIYPTTMSIADYFGRILSNEDLKKKFAEIAIKPAQNTLHLAINVPSDTREAKVLGLNSEGIYARLGLDEIANYIAPFMNSAEEAYDYAASKLVSYNRTPLIIAATLGIGGAIYLFFFTGRKKSV